MKDSYTTVATDFNPFAGPVIHRLAPITEPQAEIWAACLVGGDTASRAYNEALALYLTGPLHADALQRALEAVVAQHDALRTTFSADGQYLCVLAPAPLALTCHDISALTPAAQQEWLAAYGRQEVQHVFDLVAGPLLRAALVRLGAADHCFVFTVHHIVCDGWSIGVLLQDLGRHYSAFAQHRPSELPAPPSFGCYAEAQAAYYQSEEYHRTEQFWVEQFRGPVPALDVPTDRPRPAARTYASNRRDHPLPSPLVAALKKTGQQAGCSFVTTLLAVFEVLLHQLTGQEDLVVGLPAAGQAALADGRLVGHCVNLLPLRSRPAGELRFVDFLLQRKAALFDVYDHQNLTFGSLLKKLPSARATGRIPLVPVVFNIDLGLDNDVAFNGLSHRLTSFPRAYESFELFVNASGSQAELLMEWSYNTALFDAATIDQMMARFERLIGAIVDSPGAKIKDLGEAPAVLAAAYADLNATARPYPAAQTLHGLVAAQAQATPHKTAIQLGAAELSYQTLDEQANRLAHHLLGQGVRVGDVVGLAVGRTPELLVALLAVMKCGAAYLPLDPQFPRERIAYMLADSAARFLIVSAHPAAAYETTARVFLLKDLVAEAAGSPAQAPDVSVASSQRLYVLYTSGSTGKPKGVQVAHRNVVNFLASMQQAPGLRADDKLLAVTTISFDIAGLELFLPLTVGATVVLATEAEARDGHLLLGLLTTVRITAMQATPATWRMLLDAGWTQPLPLKALCGGEALPADLARQLVPKCDSLWNLYGPTETTIWSAVKHITDPTGLVTIGQPIANTQFYVVDETLRPVKPGAIGELVIGGDGVALGYLDKPALTDERFVADPFGPVASAKLYRTGDLGKLLPNGELQCLGRLDNQIKLRGYRIEPGEIEHALTALAGINAAVVTVYTPPSGYAQLHAHVIAHGGAVPVSADALISQWKQALGRQLPAYMVPAKFFLRPAFPLTANGKIDRKALINSTDVSANSTGSGANNHTEVAEKAKIGYVNPRTDTEKIVAGIWMQLLNVEKVGAYDDFFDLGGYSLIAVQAMVLLEKATGKRLPLATLFEHPTVEKIALMLAMDSKFITWDSLVPIKPQGNKTPLYIVHGAGLNVLIFNGLARNMQPDQPVYGLQAQGLNGVDEPFKTVEQMAAHYIAAILQKDPVGPYALAGYSFGGIIAFEMTKQLKALGKKVKVLIAFDTYISEDYIVTNVLKKRMYRAKHWVNILLHNLLLIGKKPSEIITYRIKNAKVTFNKYYLILRYGKAKQHEIFFQQPLKLGQMIDKASECYCVTPLDVKLELFRVKKTLDYAHEPEYLGWKNVALKGINITEIPGDHDQLFAPPHDVEIARILQSVLDSYD
ncbi:amino acid adenylation domain-containing protein [Hymenobacter caeli]|uniref:Amino acid adenylation domain-containing protein n=1 Tax=Hymenobacter caeli TaxID=2735894 RepID=A0ABX2FRW5_9BACT|nr:non-ribosomal peptide synthetase [Hymenobacter caeli]NRT19687.1 amino acid adenylation domain-containing protein [Hymenobacter caeli]